jgi:hypothetical protein
MGYEGGTAVTRPEIPVDPWADQRVEMPAREFDGVDAFVASHAAAGQAPPPPALGAYLDAALPQPEFAEALPALVADLSGFLTATVPEPVRANEATRSVIDEYPRSRKWRGPATLRWLVEGMATGRADGMSLSFDGPRGEPDRYWFLDVYCRPGRTDRPLSIHLVASPNLWPADRVDTVSEELLRLIEGWAGPLRLLTAAVTFDRVEPAATPYELWTGRTPQNTELETDRKVRGYYWANLLTAGHLEAYGDGLAEAAREAGMAVVPVRGSSIAPACWVRDPAHLSAFADDRLAAMKRLLGPVLPPYPYVLYHGWPLRILKDPGTAFRRIPAGAPGPRFI